MTLLRQIRTALQALLHRRQADVELDEELRFHIEQRCQELQREGMNPSEARRRALVELGGPQQIKEEVRALRAGVWLETLWQDLRYAARQLRRNPGFAAVAILTLALGIGANAAIFSVLHAALLKPLPYRDPDRVILLWQEYPQKGLDAFPLSPANLALYRDHSQTLEIVGGFSGTGVALTGQGEPEQLKGMGVTTSLLDVLGVQPLLGRNFLLEEDVPKGRPACILMHGFWQRRFGAAPDIVGKTILLDGAPAEVVGVMPAEFIFPRNSTFDIMLPLAPNYAKPNPFYITLVGRLKPGVTPGQAQADTTRLLLNFARQREEPPPPNADLRTVVYPVQEALVRGSRTTLLLLMVATGAVLLIACANVAGLFLARATRRTREVALRLTLGASRARVARQLLVESTLLALAGAGIGLALATAMVRALRQLPPDLLPRAREITVDQTVLGFTAAIAVATGLLFGLAPALRCARSGLLAEMQEGARGSSGAAAQRMNKTLAAAQFALSLVLLVGAGLLLKSFQHLLAVDPGFQPENVLTMAIALPPSASEANDGNTSAEPREVQFFEGLLDRVRGIAGVRSAAVTTYLPFSGNSESDNYIIEGQDLATAAVAPVAQIRYVTSDYFRTLEIPLREGRAFQPTDTQNSPWVAIVDEPFARRHWPGGDALGKQVRFAWRTANPPPPWMTIVGVVKSVKHEALDERGEPHLYLPFRQWQSSYVSLAVRTAGDPAAATSAVLAKIHEMDPNLPASAIMPLTVAIGNTLERRKLTNLLLAGFAVLAAALAAVGIYGVMSLHVGSRIRELGIRMALGAMPKQVVHLVLRQAIQIALAGIVLGAAGALLLTRSITSLLFEVEAQDPAVFLAAAAGLALVALLACWVPARRAMRVDPAVTLRYE